MRDDHVEERGDVDRVDHRVVRHSGGAHRVGVLGRELAGPERQLLDEAEHRAQPVVDRRGAPVALDRLPDLVTERIRRDRAVGVRSEVAFVEVRDVAREELPLGRPTSRTAPRIATSSAAENGRPKSSGR